MYSRAEPHSSTTRLLPAVIGSDSLSPLPPPLFPAALPLYPPFTPWCKGSLYKTCRLPLHHAPPCPLAVSLYTRPPLSLHQGPPNPLVLSLRNLLRSLVPVLQVPRRTPHA